MNPLPTDSLSINASSLVLGQGNEGVELRAELLGAVEMGFGQLGDTN